jgi:hypothetical protein
VALSSSSGVGAEYGDEDDNEVFDVLVGAVSILDKNDHDYLLFSDPTAPIRTSQRPPPLSAASWKRRCGCGLPRTSAATAQPRKIAPAMNATNVHRSINVTPSELSSTAP